MKKFKEVVSEERSSEVITELDDRGLALRLNFYKFEKEGDRDLVGIKQSNESNTRIRFGGLHEGSLLREAD